MKGKGFAPPPAEFDQLPQNQYVLDVILNCEVGSVVGKDKSSTHHVPLGIRPCPPGEIGQPLVIPILLATVEQISTIRLHVPRDLRPLPARETVWRSVLEVQQRFLNVLPILDPEKHMKITGDKFKDLCRVRTNSSIYLVRTS